MNEWLTAVVSYVIAIIISFFVAGLIQLMVAVLARFTKPESSEDEVSGVEEPVGQSNDDSAIAAVIAIAKHRES